MATNQFMVFGHDARDIGRLWISAWRDILFGDDSPVRRVLDGVVNLRSESSVESFQSWSSVDFRECEYEAVGLPDDLVLCRALKLPASADVDVASAVQLEVVAHSPFAFEDTSFGWWVRRDDQDNSLVAEIAMVSRASVMHFLGEKYSIHDPLAKELWGRTPGRWVILNGFGEAEREKSYQKRLIKVAVMGFVSILLLVAAVGVSAFMAKLELSSVEAIQAETTQAAKPAIRKRDLLAARIQAGEELSALAWRFPNPHLEIKRLTELLPDDVFLNQFSLDGRTLKVRGLGKDAAGLMQKLTEREEFKSVTAPQAIRRMGNSGQEQFHLEIDLGYKAQ